ncbi:hypothetical protein DPMN_145094 [Dreissena polymorpha]|uniref:C-type lectin domain-containing protein n=1 Tax=Dreissena polymorpha TaxID=45954 RepID=A0A9D4F3C1_DREPO|nr:hypothetical protein DPMN_145094 [Dreissena polymorpha]
MPRFRNSCYFVSSTQRNWTEARTSCERHGGHLAVVNDAEEYTFLVQMIKTSDWFSFPVYWLGGYRPANSLACKWVNSDDWAFVKLQQTISLSNEEICLSIQKDLGYFSHLTDEDRRWIFVSCNNTLNYICEI